MRLRNETDKDEFIKYLISDDALFHYTQKTTALEHILNSKKLKFGRFSGTNDPQEYRPKMPGAVGWAWDTEKGDVSRAMREIDVICQKKSGFISFCTNSYENDELVASGFLKSRMWSQYGDNHEGACIVISKEKLKHRLSSLVCEEREALTSFVTYKNPDRENQPILHVNQSDFELKDYNDVALQFVLNNIDNYFFSKQTDYRDENEYRVVVINKNNNVGRDIDIFLGVEDALVGVVFGDRFPEVYTPSVKKLLRDTDVAARQLIWNKGGYYLYGFKDEK